MQLILFFLSFTALSAAGYIVFPAVKNSLKQFLASLRLSRHIYYTAVFAAGFFTAAKSWPRDIYPPAAGAVIINLLFASSLVINNIYDSAIDDVNRKGNTANLGGISHKGYYAAYCLICGSAIFLSLAVSLAVFIVTAVIIAASWGYSSPPLRIKKIFPLNIMMISFSTLLAMALGFACSPGKALLPVRFGTALFAALAMAFNTKDINDYAGDKKYGVKTIMTIYGPEKGRAIISFLAFAGYLAVAGFSGAPILFIPAIICGAITALYIRLSKGMVNEPFIFALFFVFAAVFVFIHPALV
jgi:4-hydroxybenzoate polyprenyltransferase